MATKKTSAAPTSKPTKTAKAAKAVKATKAVKPTKAAEPAKAPKAKPRKSSASTRSSSAATSAPASGFSPYSPKKGEEYMSAGMKQHFREILFRWKQELMEEVDRTVGHMKEDAANFADPADRATQEEEFSLELRTRDRERKLIKKIDEAMTRLDISDYGYCETCGIEIGVRRLEARPTAELCIDCKTMQEIKEKQMA